MLVLCITVLQSALHLTTRWVFSIKYSIDQFQMNFLLWTLDLSKWWAAHVSCTCKFPYLHWNTPCIELICSKVSGGTILQIRPTKLTRKYFSAASIWNKISYGILFCVWPPWAIGRSVGGTREQSIATIPNFEPIAAKSVERSAHRFSYIVLKNSDAISEFRGGLVQGAPPGLRMDAAHHERSINRCEYCGRTKYTQVILTRKHSESRPSL